MGRGHASPGTNGNGGQYYESDEARKRVEEVSSEINIYIVPFEELVYLPFEDEYQPLGQIAEGTQTISLSGSDIRRRIRTGRKIPDWATFPEVMEELQKAYPPPGKQGIWSCT